MTEIPTLQFEAKVRAATRRTNKSGDWWSVTLEIQPHDFREELCTMAQAQQRVMAVLAAIGDDEQPKAPEKPKRAPATTRAEKARRLCGVPEFQRWIGERIPYWDSTLMSNVTSYERTDIKLKYYLSVKSKSDLDPKPGAVSMGGHPADKWDALLSEYEQQAGRMAERH